MQRIAPSGIDATKDIYSDRIMSRADNATLAGVPLADYKCATW